MANSDCPTPDQFKSASKIGFTSVYAKAFNTFDLEGGYQLDLAGRDYGQMQVKSMYMGKMYTNSNTALSVFNQAILAGKVTFLSEDSTGCKYKVHVDYFDGDYEMSVMASHWPQK